MSEAYPEPRQERREQKRQSQRAKMEKHGKGMAQIYRDVVLKRQGKDKTK